MLEWTTAGAMVDKNGYYSIVAPVGPHVVKAMMMGYVTGFRHADVTPGDTVIVDFVLTKDPKYDQSKVIVIPEEFDYYIDPWPYDASLEPVRWDALEFELRYVLTEQDDSVLVNVVAEGKNVTDEPFSACGRFVFWDSFVLSEEVSSELRRSKNSEHEGLPAALDVSADTVPKVLHCRPITVGAGHSISRGISFTFDPSAYEYWAADVRIQCYFFAGHEGVSDVVWRVYLGDLTIPIRPIGQPLRAPSRH